MINKLFTCFIISLLAGNLSAQLPNKDIDVLHYRCSIAVNDSNNIIKGNAEITLQWVNTAGRLKLDLAEKSANGKGMLVSAVTHNGSTLAFTQQGGQLFIENGGKSGEQQTYAIAYEGEPADGLVIGTNKNGRRTFFSDNWPNRGHNWIPCNDHTSDKATVEFLVTAPEHYEVVCNGLMVEESNLEQHTKLTHWKEEVPIAPKVFALGVAEFAVNYWGNVNCIPVSGWVYPEDREQGFKDYKLAKEILQWYITQVGPYAYEKLANIQSKTMFGGVENAGAIFYAEKSVGSPGVESLIAHEIGHQWFGDAASETDWPHLWLSEGFAIYMTHLYIEQKYGTDSLKASMAKDRVTVIKLSQKRNTPVVDTTGILNPMGLLNANSYQKGGWVLHMLRRQLGDSAFWKAVRNYYATYMNKNASTENLQHFFEEASGQRLDSFFRQWLYTPGQPKLTVTWKYNAAKQSIAVTVEQQQAQPFRFPLKLQFNAAGKVFTPTLNITGKTYTTEIPVTFQPLQMIVDPDVDLLFE
ncbi:M1 family metallopeptidase [Foetidibacter luteolus]|uniref:M1 family metallopeptidase n=1 Tax=Foetidibacter luteolus TaxID=2608880 RepID=UPI00129AC9E4|nr:M1 family metallopeptidase [Foetidibacter luteolus]